MAKKQSNIVLLKTYWWVSLLVLIPVILLTFLTLRYSVHVPFWDQWEFVKILEKYREGTLGFGDFWEQHNEHRIFFPRLIWFVLALFTAWDPYYEVIVSLLLGFASVAITWFILKRTFSKNKSLLITTGILATWLMLSPIQQENWLWGWQIQWFLSVCAVLTAVWALTSKKLTNKLFVTAIVGGIIATYSLANGVIIWPVGLMLLFLLGSSIRKKVYWTVAGALMVGVNYFQYVNPEYEPSKTLFLQQPGEFLHYILVYIGRPLSSDFLYAHVVGLVLLIGFLLACVYLFFYNQKNSKQFLPWLAIGLYALAGAVLTGISRMGLGVEQSYSSRYTTISTLFVVATVVLTVGAIVAYTKKHKLSKLHQRIAIYVVIIPVVAAMLLNYAAGVYYMKEKNQHLQQVRNCAQTAQSQNDDCLLLLYPNKVIVWERLKYLRSQNLGGF